MNSCGLLTFKERLVNIFQINIIACLLSIWTMGIAQVNSKDLPTRYRTWLEEEVVYIITSVEREVFLQLRNDRERDIFIEAFWRQRDPIPGNTENEFKIEHMRRLDHAQRYFGRDSPSPGWKTDRGRIYIIIGEPNDIQRFDYSSQVYPTEIWFYQGKTHLGLPPGFNLVFSKMRGETEYRLYSPLGDGPQALMTTYFDDVTDYRAAYEKLRDIDTILAEVSLSYIPGEGRLTDGRPSLASDLLVQRIEETTIRQIKDLYARKFMEFKDIVEVEYSANYIGSDSLVKVIRDSSGIYFVHYAIEPETLSVNLYNDTYFTTLRLNGSVTDEDNKNIYQFEKDISLQFDEEQIQAIYTRPVSLRDMFPLIPGTYRVTILVKNEASKEFTSLERTLLIPGEENELQMTSVVLGYQLKKEFPRQGRIRPFQLGENHIYIQSNRTFTRQDDLVVGFQIHGLTPSLKEKGVIKYVITQDDLEFRMLTRSVGEYQDTHNFVETFSLKEFPPAHYRIRVGLYLENQELITSREDFAVSHMESFPRPWIHSQLLTKTSDPSYDYALGVQLYNAGSLSEARQKFESAFRARPDSVDFALDLARTYLDLGQYAAIEAVLLPFLDPARNPAYQTFLIMGIAYQGSGRMDKAIETFNRAITQYGINTDILNALGECYFQLGQLVEAIASWEKSLEINPEQPQIQKSLGAIKKKD